MRRGEKTSEVLVVGAGVIGLACAWRAAQRGLSVRVIDRDTPGAGASRVAAGMLAPVGEASWGEEALLQLNLDSARAYPGVRRRARGSLRTAWSAIAVAALFTGVALDVDEAEDLRRHHELQGSLGLAAEWPARLSAASWSPGLRLGLRGRARGGRRRGRSSHAGRRPRSGDRPCGRRDRPRRRGTDAVIEGERLRGVRIADGRELRADRVVLATGSWSGSAGWLPEDARPPVRPVKGEVVNLRGAAASPVSERIVATPGCMSSLVRTAGWWSGRPSRSAGSTSP